MNERLLDANGKVRLPDSLASPLRLEILKLFLDRPGYCADVSELSRITGRLRADVEGCVRPMVEAGLLVWGAGDAADELSLAISEDDPRFEELREDVNHRYKFVARIAEVRNRYFEGMIGVDEKMAVVFEMIIRVAKSKIPVLILGPRGSGRDMVAHAIHELGPQAQGTLQKVHCTLIPADSLAPFILGEVITDEPGGPRVIPGKMELARGGTLFLNEIGDLPKPLQEEFVNILERGFFFPMGGTEPIPAAFRLVSTSSRPLEELVASGDFLEDLYYKINVFPIRIPALRERTDDIVVLARDVLRRYCRQNDLPEDCMYFTEAALQRLISYPWPGNIKELENAVIRAAILTNSNAITDREFDFLGGQELPEGRFRSLREVEEEHIRRVLRAHHGNVRRAAQVLGVSRGTLYERIQRYGIHLSSRRARRNANKKP
jgi:two-component system NtrC family response regulator